MKRLLFIISSIYSFYGFGQNVFDGMCTGNHQNGLTIMLDTGYGGVCDYNNYFLVFNDDFNGNTLDMHKWGNQVFRQGSLSNSTNQDYSDIANAVVSDGTCKVLGKEEQVYKRAISWLPDNEILEDGFANYRVFNYTSLTCWSVKKFEYGMFEIRCKLPKCKGVGSAFWLYDDNIDFGWEEIDFFEVWDDGTSSSRKKHNMNMHHKDGSYLNEGHLSCPTHYTGDDLSDDFHIFTLEWTPYSVSWYVDGVLRRISSRFYTLQGQATECNSVFENHAYILDRSMVDTVPMYLIFSMGISRGLYFGNPGPAPDQSSNFPAVYEIDYIRYWKKMECTDNLTITNDMINPELYNFYIADNIYVSNNVSVTTNNQLNLTAGESITIEPGFNTQNNAFFSAEIKPNQCSTGFSGFIDNSDGSTTVNENKKMIYEKEMFIYPNPVTDLLTIENNEIQDIKLYSLNGDEMKINYSIQSNKTTLSMADITPGLYFLVLYNNNGSSSTFKIIKE